MGAGGRYLCTRNESAAHVAAHLGCSDRGVQALGDGQRRDARGYQCRGSRARDVLLPLPHQRARPSRAGGPMTSVRVQFIGQLPRNVPPRRSGHELSVGDPSLRRRLGRHCPHHLVLVLGLLQHRHVLSGGCRPAQVGSAGIAPWAFGPYGAVDYRWCNQIRCGRTCILAPLSTDDAVIDGLREVAAARR